ncbi:MAG: preprotein translocase subunit SecG, partial [Bacteroidales bacterium]|nr:preprotein translocase subunit SecG [Bacteroidales bacterium]
MGLYILVSVFILMVSGLIILVVLVQNSKGGGLASNFSGSNQYMGVRKTADFLEKATWTLAIALLVLSLASIFVIPKGGESVNKVTQVEERAGDPLPMPTAPAPGTGQ